MTVGLGLLVVIALIVFGVSMARHRLPGRRADGVPTQPAERHSGHVAPTDLRGALTRAAARGQITTETADSILASEASEAVEALTADGRPRRVATPAVEAIGYLGSVLALVGVSFLVGRAWDDIGQPGRIGLLGGLSALFLVVGLLMRHEDEAVIRRLRAIVLLLSTGAFAIVTNVVFGTFGFGWRGEPVAISIGLLTAVFSGVLWALRDRPAQHATTMIGILIAVDAAMGWWGGPGAVGLTTVAISALWLVLAHFDLVPPRSTATLLGLAGVLVGPAITSGPFGRWAPVVGLVIAIAVLGYGAIVHRFEFEFTGFGAIGLLGYLTFAVARWFGDSLKAPGVLVVSGIALLTATLILVKRGRGNGDDGHRPSSAAH
ncbi:MAG: DUF2157 domain-containing protein [Actinobacteria bacterium]|uniref:Unannotated protein n=1 Tax=freshwater metagenome TaxID=449393 RepID=A0A6J7US82_9ZZZZ|nr:DUF2157 domain-containing protein [Actinomycetota bacterium]